MCDADRSDFEFEAWSFTTGHVVPGHTDAEDVRCTAMK